MAKAAAKKQQNALISVYDKIGIVDFVRGLLALKTENWQIIASGGTHKALVEAGLPAVDVADFVGGQAILGHKVVTLSREMGAGLLADLGNKAEMAEMQALGLPIIHLVCQDSYPLESEIVKPNATPASVLAQSDIGGPTMLREAAKGGRIVLSVPEQRQQVLEWLRAGRPNEAEYVRELANRAVYEVARYSMIEAKYWNGTNISGYIALQHAPLKYGENPHQTTAALYADNRVNVNPLGIEQFVHVKGWQESYINETDIYRLVQTSTHIAAGFERNFGQVPAMAIGVKHGNACGAGVAKTHVEAVQKMLTGDLRAIHGGVVMINGEINTEIAQTLMTYGTAEGTNRLLDGVVGASASDDALEILSRAKLRVVVNPALKNLGESSLDRARIQRCLGNAVLEQDGYTFVMDLAGDYTEQYGKVSKQQKRDMILGWAVGSTSNSNTIVLVKNGQVIGNGVGQQDRVGAAQLALARTTTELPTFDFKSGIAGEDGNAVGPEFTMKIKLDSKKISGAVAYSDSFFPYPDGPKVLADAGIKAILTSSGSINDNSILPGLAKIGVSVVTVPDKTGRGFFGH